jgi:hypothetical protein
MGSGRSPVHIDVLQASARNSIYSSQDNAMSPWHAEEELRPGVPDAATAGMAGMTLQADNSSSDTGSASRGSFRASGSLRRSSGGSGALAASKAATAAGPAKGAYSRSSSSSVGGGVRLPAGGVRRSSSTAGGDKEEQLRALSSSLSIGSREQEAGGTVGKADVLTPAARAPGPNRKFLERYSLGKMGLFAP